MTHYLLSAVMFLLLASGLVTVLVVVAACHMNGMERVRRAESRFARDLALSQENHPAGKRR